MGSTAPRLWILAILLLALAGVIYYQTTQRPPAAINLELPGKLSVGKTVDVPLRVSTKVAMNAAEFYFAFPPELLEVEAIDQGGSFYTLWIKDQPTFDNTTGLLSLAGGLPKPGFTGRNGLVATVRVRALKAGSGQVTLDTAKSRILANDGLGTKIEASFEPISFTID